MEGSWICLPGASIMTPIFSSFTSFPSVQGSFSSLEEIAAARKSSQAA